LQAMAMALGGRAGARLTGRLGTVPGKGSAMNRKAVIILVVIVAIILLALLVIYAANLTSGAQPY
jgi:hypothetical protein